VIFNKWNNYLGPEPKNYIYIYDWYTGGYITQLWLGFLTLVYNNCLCHYMWRREASFPLLPFFRIFVIWYHRKQICHEVSELVTTRNAVFFQSESNMTPALFRHVCIPPKEIYIIQSRVLFAWNNSKADE
jgi:hypothetical protein